MAWQLIYTSAPRLLEAGRTGFGTVARHRAVSALLVAAVERYSQFARLPGLGARRVIYSHRILTAGAGQYHVLSCVRDAGSDYTGRTNHLAHHLIADAGEVRALAGTNITPADVLLQMSWRMQWAEPPRFLEPAEEVALAGLRARVLGSAWERVAGSAEMARLPSGRSLQRCFLVLPPDVPALELFRESLAFTPGHGWQTTFTTSLEPTDDMADFRWIGIPAGSPLRSMADGAARGLLDLTLPQTLPQPEALVDDSLPKPAQVRTARDPQASARVVPLFPAAREAPATPGEAEALPGAVPEPFVTAKPGRAKGSWAAVAISAVVLAVGVGGFVAWQKYDASEKAAAREVALAARVDDLWRQHRLALRVTANWLKQNPDEALISAHAKALEAMAGLLQNPGQAWTPHRPEKTQDEFSAMLGALERWHEAQKSTAPGPNWNTLPPGEMRRRADQALRREKLAWDAFAQSFQTRPANPSTLRADLFRLVLDRITPAMPQGAPSEWYELLAALDPEGVPPDWLNSWVTLAGLPAEPAPLAAGDLDLVKAFTKSPGAPSWFTSMAAARLAAAEKVQSTPAPAPGPASSPPSAPAPPPAPEKETADNPAGTHPLWVLLETPAQPLARALASLPELPTPPGFQIWAGAAGAAEKNLVRWKSFGAEGVFRKNIQEATTLEFANGRLVRLPQEAGSWRVIGREEQGTKVLFELFLISTATPPAVVMNAAQTPVFEAKDTGGRLFLVPAAASWLGRLQFPLGRPIFRLESPGQPGALYQVKLADDGQAEIVAVTTDRPAVSTARQVVAIQSRIAELRAAVAQDLLYKKELQEGNLSKREKDDRDARVSAKIGENEALIGALEEQMRGMTAQPPGPAPVRRPLSGRHILSLLLHGPAGEEQVQVLGEILLKIPAPAAGTASPPAPAPSSAPAAPVPNPPPVKP